MGWCRQGAPYKDLEIVLQMMNDSPAKPVSKLAESID